MRKIIILTLTIFGFSLAKGVASRFVLGRPETIIINWLDQCRIQKPYRYQNLTLFPIVTNRQSRFEYLTLEEGLKCQYLEITELGSGEVNKVRVRNQSKYYIFGLAGELILGAKQDRMLKEDVLLPPFSGWLEIPVYCTEHGRWTAQTPKFYSRGLIVPGMLRQTARKTESQVEVWQEVDRFHTKLNIHSPTKALKEVYEASRVFDLGKPYLRELIAVPSQIENIIGVVVVVGDRIICADLFANHSLLEKMWKKLLRSYVIDAIAEPKDNGITINQVEQFLKSIRDCNFTNLPTPGAGQLVRFKSKSRHKFFKPSVVGSALIFRDDVVHLDLFPQVNDFASEPQPIPRLDIRRERLYR
ncbi:MAG: DUF6569 family protein [candidate division WOR-3 bacterium]